MRLFILLILAIGLLRAETDDHLLNSLKHAHKRHDLPTETTIQSHEHPDIRSSDKFLKRREQPSSTEVIGDKESIPDKFDQDSYDFMLPEGKAEKPTIVAVVDFITKKGNTNTPKFSVNFDENSWFDIGEVTRTKADNADVYKATVILKEGADVQLSKTDNGLYKFIVEALDGVNVLATTNVAVDVLNLAPTTRRAVESTVESVTVLSTTVETTVAQTTVAQVTVAETVPTTTEQESTSEASLSSTESGEEGSGHTEDLVLTSLSTSSPDNEGSSGMEASGIRPDSSTELLSNDLSSEKSGESPIEGPVTIIPLRATQEGKIETELETMDATINLEGLTSNSKLKLQDAQKRGDMVRNLRISVNSNDTISNINLSVEPSDGFEIRPHVLNSNEEAYLFLKRAPKSSETIEIVAKLPTGEVLRRPVSIRPSDLEKALVRPSKVEIRQVEFAVLETAENGRTVGSLDGEMRIVGEQDRFSIVGNDIILTCSQFETDHCLQSDSRKTFTLMLLPKNGSLSPIQVTILVQQTPSLRTSEEMVRISDNRIINPFAILTEQSSSDVKVSGDASRFLSVRKNQDGLWQLIVRNSAPSGKHTLVISLDTLQKSIPVFVSNSLSHAHFRQNSYSVKVDAKTLEESQQLTQVELEGVPIDEAQILILDGNPGWITVEGYGGKVRVSKRFDGKIFGGKFNLRIGAVDRKTWSILTETSLEVVVENGEEHEVEKPVEEKSRIVEATFDREKSESLKIQLESSEDLKLLPESIFGVDENGKRVKIAPENLKIAENHVELNKESVQNLRILSAVLTGDNNRKETLLVRLVSSPEHLEMVEKLSARPVYPEPWVREKNEVIEVDLPEELLPGQVVGVFPAIIPTTGAMSNVALDGEMKEAFEYDQSNGQLKIQHRIDYESLSDAQKVFNLRLRSGETAFESVADIKFKVRDIDDNSPIITKAEIGTVSLPENLAPGSKIAEFDVTDPDGSPSYDVQLSGRGSQNYRANITNSGLLSIFLSPNANLDREAENSHSLLVKVEDVSKNVDRILIPIQILDVNDNSPMFDRKIYEVEAVEDWPNGMVIGKISAHDADLGNSGKIRYRLESDHENLININETNGILTTFGELYGMARAEPYTLRVIASDMGQPSMNSTSFVHLRIRSIDEVMVEPVIEFLEPKNGFVLHVNENIPHDQKIFTSKAEVKGHRLANSADNLIFSLRDIDPRDDEPIFEIDKHSGEIFAIGPVDFEKISSYTEHTVILQMGWMP